MSWTRWGPSSDLYVYESVTGIVCCECLLEDEFESSDRDDWNTHISQHVLAGHKVPASAWWGDDDADDFPVTR